MKFCKVCNSEITHYKKRKLCTECLKKEMRDVAKFNYYRNKSTKEINEKVKIKTDICKCGNKIEHKYKRNICLDCLREYNRLNYAKNSKKYYENKRAKNAN